MVSLDMTSPDGILDAVKADAPFSAAQCLAAVARQCGKSPLAQVRDFARLHFGPGRLTLQEYFQFRLYDDSRYDAAEKRRFLGHRAQQRLYAHHIPMGWRAIAGDKIVFYALFAGLGHPVPQTRALFHPTRGLGAATPLRGTEDLAAWLRESDHYPFFGKPADGIWSIGVLDAEGYDAPRDRVLLADGRSVAVDDLVTAMQPYFGGGYLIQQRLAPHPEVARVIGERVSTVRLMVMLGPDGPELTHALWKIPAAGNVADNFWRDGNMLAALEAESGVVRRVVRGVGPAQETLHDHPDTGARLEGFALPHWPAVRALCRTAAAAIPGLPLQAWDIALCPEGPVLVETNIGGDVNLPQIAAGEGFMDDRLAAFLGRSGG